MRTHDVRAASGVVVHYTENTFITRRKPMNHHKQTKKAARRIENRTPLDDAYDLVCRAERRAREHLTDELDGLLSECWMDDAALMIACAAAREQAEFIDEYSDGDDVFVDSRSYREIHRQIGLDALEDVLDLGLYGETVIPACGEALRIASGVIKDGVMQPA